MKRKKSRYKISYRGTGYLSPGVMITTYMPDVKDTAVVYAGNCSVLDPYKISKRSPEWVIEILRLVEHGSDVRRIIKKLPDRAFIQRENKKIFYFEAAFDLEVE